MISFDQSLRLAALRERIWTALAEALREDGHRKSSDGLIEVTMTMPAAFDRSPPSWQITIWSCVLCERGRSEMFDAPTFEGALCMAEAYAEKICFRHEMEAYGRVISATDDSPSDSDDDEPFPT